MGRAVPAVSRALDILELFLDRPALSAPQITELLGLPRTTVHELVSTLVERGYLDAAPGELYRRGRHLPDPDRTAGPEEPLFSRRSFGPRFIARTRAAF